MKNPTALKIENQNALIEKSLIFKAYEKVKYELPILILLLTLYIPQRLNITDDIYSMLHVFDYRIGFAPRLFIGSIMSLFTDYKSQAFMSDFFSIVFIIEAILFAYVAGRIIRKASDETAEITVFLAALFFAIPYSLAVLYPRLLSLDRFMVIFTLLAFIVINKKVFKWFVPALLFMGLATYNGFAFTYMPAIAILLIYEIYRNKNAVQSILLCVVGFVTMAGFSAYFFLFDGLDKYKNVEELIAYASDKTDLQFIGYSKDVVETLLFKTPAEFFWNATVPLDGLKGFYHEFTSMIFLIPMIIIFFSIWKYSIKNSSNKFEKLVFIMCLLAPIARFPMFILSTNFYRGRISVVVVQFFLVFYFLYTGNKSLTASVKRLGAFFKEHYLLFLLMISYFALSFLSFRTGEFWSEIMNALLGRL